MASASVRTILLPSLLLFVAEMAAIQGNDECICAHLSTGYKMGCQDSGSPKLSVCYSQNDQRLDVICPCDQSHRFVTLKSNLYDKFSAKTVRFLNVTFCGIPSTGFSTLVPGDPSTVVRTSFRSCGKQQLPGSAFANLRRLRRIDLIVNDIDHLPPTVFRNLSRLRELFLKGDSLRHVRDLFVDLTSLETLALDLQKLDCLDDREFRGLVNLSHFSLVNNTGLMSISAPLFSFSKNLTFIKLRDNKIEHLEARLFENNAKLQTLHLNQNLNLNSPPDLFLQDAHLLEELHIAGSLFVRLRKTHPVLKLKRLSLYGDVPWSISNETFPGLANLNTLNLTGNRLKEVDPTSFSSLPSLKTLDLSFNELGKIDPNLLDNLVNLIELKLNGNRLKEVDPTSFSSLPLLTVVDLSSNKLDEINPDLFSNLRNLIELDLSRNELREIDRNCFRNLIALQKLDLSANSLLSLPHEVFGRLVNLRELSLKRNSISDLDALTFANLTGLKRLDLSSNKLESLREQTFGQNVHLISLDLSSNNLNEINCSLLTNLSSLQRLDLSNSSLSLIANQTFSKLGSLVELDLKINNLTRIEDGALDGLTQVKRLSLRLNGLRSISQSALHPLKALEILDLSVNELNFGESHSASPLSQNGNLSWIQLSRNKVDRIWPDWRAFTKLNYLGLGNNRLIRIDADQLQFQSRRLEIDLLNNKIAIVDFSQFETGGGEPVRNVLILNGNPLNCNCSNLDFSRYIKHINNAAEGDRPKWDIGADDLLCDLPEKSRGTAFLELNFEQMCFVASRLVWPWIATGFVCAAFLALAAYWTLYCCRYNHFHLFGTAERRPDMVYDAFISYASPDEHFVLNHLVPKLEKPGKGLPVYKLCLHKRDWIAGEFIPKMIQQSVAESSRTIIVLSQHFLKSYWCNMEFRTAFQYVVNDSGRRLIILVHGEMPPAQDVSQELRNYLFANAYIRSDDPFFWRKLRRSLPPKSDARSKMCRWPCLSRRREGNEL